MADTDDIYQDDEGTYIVHGSMKVNGNLEVGNQLTAHGLDVVDSSGNTLMLANDNGAISFRKACEFTRAVQFNNGRTIIGIESTYNSAYVGSPTIQAGKRLVLGDSAAKWDVDSRKVIADTFNMTLRSLVAD